VGARLLVPIHYEAYYSSLVPYDERARRCEEETKKRGLEDRVVALRHRRAAGAADGRRCEPWVSNDIAAGEGAAAR